MSRTLLDGIIEVVTSHNLAVVLVILLLTGGLVVGITNAEMGGEGGFAGTIETDVDDADQYIQENYESGDGDDDSKSPFPVYVRESGGNVLSPDALIATLEYKQTAVQDDAVSEARKDDQPLSIASLVGTEAAGDHDASIETQIEAIEKTDEDTLTAIVTTILAEDPEAQFLLPNSYEPGTAEAESTQLVFTFEATEDGEPPSEAQYALADAADEAALDVFTLGEPAMDEMSETNVENTVFLVLPVVLGLILAVATFAYRNAVDVFVGIVGVIVSIIWMFGILGWLGVEVGPAVVIGPVLIAGLSIDYGFHVFTRYREERGTDEEIRPPMARGLRSVAIAFGLVTITASIGFLANLTNPVSELQDLGIAITLGVLSAFVVFVTFVPALKLSIDATLARIGLTGHQPPLGDGAYLGPLLASTVTLARRAAPIVVVLAVVLAAGGAVGWTALDEESVGAEELDVAEWKQDLPDPIGWEDNEALANQAYVGEQFRSASAAEGDRVQILVDGSVTDDETLYVLENAIDDGVESGTFAESRADTIETPMTVIQAVAATDDEFAATVAAADTTDDGIPDSDLPAVYDHLYEVDPDRANTVIERADGEYRSLRVIGPPQAADGPAIDGDRADALFAVGDQIEDPDLEATVVSDATAEQAAIERITDGIVRVMVVAVAAVFFTLMGVYRWLHDSATLGALTATPVALVLGYVAGGMYVLDVPLNFLTALLLSLVIGIGIDYSIHLSDRFVHERGRGRSDITALETAVTGTGGALLGSMLTSVAAFAGMLIHPDPSFQNFATLVILAMVAAFVASVIVLPSVLYLWSNFRERDSAVEAGTPDTSVSAQD